MLDSEAALLITSHDRRFIECLGQRFLLIVAGELIEMPGLDAALARMRKDAGVAGTKAASPVPTGDVFANEEDSERLLEQIVSLEEKLAADEARKKKFQKPKLQAERRLELDTLYARLEGLDQSDQ
ncbi:MAG: hypothetical protein QF921_15160 [Pseudomonadales bacterium]|nr:hypothetical protein [Pseudomonadales bacterium]MDP6470961.1 hypothetical protein [Pseudomonadales bacterium]MDP6825854.1 hypothetical protein [Pseudomonadales bacterium]MDP6972821.1 hypothetical protein [Pseudomonadales bacterium]